MSNVIPFKRITSANVRGLQVGDRVRHKTYGWDGVIATFDWRGPIADYAFVEAAIGSGPAKMVAVEIGLLQKLYEGEAA